MKQLIVAACVLGAACVAEPGRAELSGAEVLSRIDENLFFDRALVHAHMIIHGRSGDRNIESRTWRRGVDSALVEYLAPPRDAGKKMLKLGDKLWNYIPEPTDRIIAISGHLLRQSVMGSDLSYEDMTENHRLRDRYEAAIVGRDTLEGRRCLVLQLSAVEVDVAYYSRKIWVDEERWLPLREERFAKSGRLLKTTSIHEVTRLANRWYPKRMIFKDELASAGGTEYIVDSIDTSVDVPDYLLSKAALRK